MDIKQLLLQEDNLELMDQMKISHILYGIHISGLMPLSRNLEKNIKEKNIKVIISITENKITSLENYCKNMVGMEYYHFPADDVENFNISKYFEPTYKIIHKALTDKKNVLVHCMAGISRSVTIVTSFLMRVLRRRFPPDRRIIFEEVLKIIKISRPIANPNSGFVKQLLEYKH